MNTYEQAQELMRLFRDDEVLNSLSAEERTELFMHSLIGASDITEELLQALCNDYCKDVIIKMFDGTVNNDISTSPYQPKVALL